MPQNDNLYGHGSLHFHLLACTFRSDRRAEKLNDGARRRLNQLTGMIQKQQRAEERRGDRVINKVKRSIQEIEAYKVLLGDDYKVDNFATLQWGQSKEGKGARLSSTKVTDSSQRSRGGEIDTEGMPEMSNNSHESSPKSQQEDINTQRLPHLECMRQGRSSLEGIYTQGKSEGSQQNTMYTPGMSRVEGMYTQGKSEGSQQNTMYTPGMSRVGGMYTQGKSDGSQQNTMYTPGMSRVEGMYTQGKSEGSQQNTMYTPGMSSVEGMYTQGKSEGSHQDTMHTQRSTSITTRINDLHIGPKVDTPRSLGLYHPRRSQVKRINQNPSRRSQMSCSEVKMENTPERSNRSNISNTISNFPDISQRLTKGALATDKSKNPQRSDIENKEANTARSQFKYSDRAARSRRRLVESKLYHSGFSRRVMQKEVDEVVRKMSPEWLRYVRQQKRLVRARTRSDFTIDRSITDEAIRREQEEPPGESPPDYIWNMGDTIQQDTSGEPSENYNWRMYKAITQESSNELLPNHRGASKAIPQGPGQQSPLNYSMSQEPSGESSQNYNLINNTTLQRLKDKSPDNHILEMATRTGSHQNQAPPGDQVLRLPQTRRSSLCDSKRRDVSITDIRKRPPLNRSITEGVQKMAAKRTSGMDCF